MFNINILFSILIIIYMFDIVLFGVEGGSNWGQTYFDHFFRDGVLTHGLIPTFSHFHPTAPLELAVKA